MMNTDRDPESDELRTAKGIFWCALGSLACIILALIFT